MKSGNTRKLSINTQLNTDDIQLNEILQGVDGNYAYGLSTPCWMETSSYTKINL